jgi:hypothetical protein
LLDAFVEKIKIIINEKKVKQLQVFTSAEGPGKQGEYIRFGMDYKMWLGNIYMLLEKIPGLNITIMSTYNVLSIVGYIDFLKDILEIKKAFPASSAETVAQTRLLLDIPYLRYPPHQSIFVIPASYSKYLDEQIQFINGHIEHEINNYGFNRFEEDKLKRVRDLIKCNTESDETTNNRQDFVKFVDEHDRRRSTNFKETFPELLEFYNSIKDNNANT